MKRVIIYCRISSDDQSHYSISHQEDVLRAYCLKHNYVVQQVIHEDYSAKTFDRPEYQKLVKAIKAKKSLCDGFAFLRWDRFSRNSYESMFQIRFLRSHGIEPMCHDQPIDFNSPDSKILLAIYLTTPEVENDKISLRTIEGIRKAKRLGYWTSHAPVGYINQRDKDGNPSLVPHPEKAPIITKAFHMLAYNKCTMADILIMFKANKITTSRAHTDRIVRNVAYAGKILLPAYRTEPEKLIDAHHKPLIPERVFAEAQQVLAGRSRMKLHVASPFFPLRGLLVCSRCKRTLTASRSKGKMGVYYGYYHCTSSCGERHSLDDVHLSMQSVMQQIQLHPAALEAYHLVLRDVFKTRSGNTDADIQKLQLELTKLIQLRDSLDEKFLMNQLPYEDYDRIKTANKIKFDEMESRLHNLRQFKKNYEEHLTYAIEKLKTIAQDFDNMTAMNKKILLSSIFPEKLEFLEKKFRTPRINSLIGSITAPNLITETARYNLAVLKNDFVSSGVATHPIFELFVLDITLLNNALRQIAA